MTLYKDDPIFMGYDGSHAVIYPNGELSDAGRGHEEFWDNEIPDALRKLKKEDPDRFEEIIDKYNIDLDDEYGYPEGLEPAAFELGYTRITTSPVPEGEGKFSMAVDYNKEHISPEALKTLQNHVGKIVDNNYKKPGFGDFEVRLNEKGLEFPTKDDIRTTNAREFSDVDDKPSYTGGIPKEFFDDDEPPKQLSYQKKQNKPTKVKRQSVKKAPVGSGVANAINKTTGRRVHFKSPMSLKQAIQMGTHEPIVKEHEMKLKNIWRH